MNISEKVLTIVRTPAYRCSACKEFRRHAAEELKEWHPLAGHGYTLETGWTFQEGRTHEDE